MEITNTTQLVLVAAIVLVVGILVGMALVRTQRTKRLKERFGPEYERVVNEMGDQRQAERELEERIAHVDVLNIRPLTADEVNLYSLQWQKIQTEFVDAPLPALQKADQLIQEVMKVKGYPVDNFEMQAADISVDYPELVTDYRGMHQIAVKDVKDQVSTEDLRQAMIHGRNLFENLIKQNTNVESATQKEKI